MMKRLFAAVKIKPGEEVLAQYYQLRKKLQHDRIKWVEPGNFHLTLKFFGETDETEIKKINSIFYELATQFSPFNIKISKTGIFGSRYSPRVIWFGLNEEEELKQLGNTVLHVCDKNGYPKGRQNFVPHLTIGRIKSVVNLQTLQAAIKDSAQFDSESIPVTEITLYESILKPGGPVYYALEKYEFGESRIYPLRR